MPGRLSNKVCIITGAGSLKGIGAATARRWASEEPLALILVGRKPEGITELAAEINKIKPGLAVTFVAEASSEKDTENCVKFAMEKYGRLDVFFANAGHGGTSLDMTSLVTMTAEEMRETMEVNVMHPFYAIKYATPAMCVTSEAKPKAGGSVIVNGSVAGTPDGKRVSADYSASKAAAHQLVNCASYQLSPKYRGVRYNVLAPGFVHTNMTGDGVLENEYVSRAPGVGRVGFPPEMAEVALFLASDESSYITGQVIVADGGLDSATPLYVKQRKGQQPRMDLSENFAGMDIYQK